MPRNKDLPRYSVGLTFSENELERLEELAAIAGEHDESYHKTILSALAAYDVAIKCGVREFSGDSIFNRKISDGPEKL